MLAGAAEEPADLSDYERARLQKILANRAVLASLGLKQTAPPPPPAEPAKPPKKPKRRAEPAEPAEGERRSKRIRGAPAPRIEIGENDTVLARSRSPSPEPVAADADPDEARVRYHALPIGPEDLDDAEFEAFLLLKKWRLGLSRKLQTEPYKVFQNRTLAEAVRRERNDPGWAGTAEGMLECWGIGPSKAKEGGFGWDLAAELAKEEVKEKLEASRKMGGVGGGDVEDREGEEGGEVGDKEEKATGDAEEKTQVEAAGAIAKGEGIDGKETKAEAEVEAQVAGETEDGTDGGPAASAEPSE